MSRLYLFPLLSISLISAMNNYFLGFWAVLLLISGTCFGQSLSEKRLTGLTKEEFISGLSTEKVVLVDFYADWCAPCKKLKPIIDEIAAELEDKVEVVRINTDENQALCRELYINAIPILQVYKNQTLTWTGEGFLPKEIILKELK
jgi:thioredoxin 1